MSGNIAEAYRKRRYPKHFISKGTDRDGEHSETRTWLDFALACNYIKKESYIACVNRGKEIG